MGRKQRQEGVRDRMRLVTYFFQLGLPIMMPSRYEPTSELWSDHSDPITS
jgi:hypothetical protein